MEKSSVRARINRRIREQQEQRKTGGLDSEDEEVDEDEEQDRDGFEKDMEEELRDEYEDLCEKFDSEEDMSYEDRQRMVKLAGFFAGEDDGGQETV